MIADLLVYAKKLIRQRRDTEIWCPIGGGVVRRHGGGSGVMRLIGKS